MEATTCVQFLIKKNQTSFILIWKVVKKIRNNLKHVSDARKRFKAYIWVIPRKPPNAVKTGVRRILQ